MQRTYAVTWQESGGPPCSGKLAFGTLGLELSGASRNGSGVLLLPYGDLMGVRIGRAAERVSGRPTLVVYRRRGQPVRIASVLASSIISEVADELASLRIGEGPAESRLLVVIPLREGVRDRVAELLDHGPPFDPEQVGLERHLVFLTDREAIFLFESATVLNVERLLAEASVWASADAWKPYVAGPPRIAEPSYLWVKRDIAEPEGLSFEPTPGPGDSDGGDVYPP